MSEASPPAQRPAEPGPEWGHAASALPRAAAPDSSGRLQLVHLLVDTAEPTCGLGNGSLAQRPPLWWPKAPTCFFLHLVTQRSNQEAVFAL